MKNFTRRSIDDAPIVSGDGEHFDAKLEGLTRDDILDNVTLYWLTNTAIWPGYSVSVSKFSRVPVIVGDP